MTPITDRETLRNGQAANRLMLLIPLVEADAMRRVEELLNRAEALLKAEFNEGHQPNEQRANSIRALLRDIKKERKQ